MGSDYLSALIAQQEAILLTPKSTLVLSISGDDENKLNGFIGRLQKLIESASSDGLHVSVNSNGNEVKVMHSDEFDSNMHLLHADLGEELIPYVGGFVKPIGVHDGAFVYRKDDMEMLRMRIATGRRQMLAPWRLPDSS